MNTTGRDPNKYSCNTPQNAQVRDFNKLSRKALRKDISLKVVKQRYKRILLEDTLKRIHTTLFKDSSSRI